MTDCLKCLVCGREFDFRPNDIFCPGCQQPGLFLNSISGQIKINRRAGTPLEKFASFLPLEKVRPELSLGEGETPLLSLVNLDPEGRLLAKLESTNPTLSFKDRGSVLVVQKALELGWPAVGTVSTGNMASSTAAYAARAGLDCLLLVKKGTSAAALLSSSVFNPRIVEVAGDYGQLFRESYELGKSLGIYFANSVDPIRLEGYKLTAFEICLQLGKAPDFVYVPVSSGGHFVGLWKGFLEMNRAGFIQKMPVMVGVQAAACAPIAQAFTDQRERVDKIQPSETIAHSISNADPPAGNLVLKLAGANNGRLTSVTDEDMLRAQKELAMKEGLFVQPESASTLAAYLKLPTGSEGTSVLIMTGQGLKAAHQPGLESIDYQAGDIPDLKNYLRSVYRQK
ncbi:MAG: threonine synthase [Candidatus Saccharicenans sp.]|nr:threonine synthase [Candidatus Saccharicenans sp.]